MACTAGACAVRVAAALCKVHHMLKQFAPNPDGSSSSGCMPTCCQSTRLAANSSKLMAPSPFRSTRSTSLPSSRGLT
jgi:hypothetical protein